MENLKEWSFISMMVSMAPSTHHCPVTYYQEVTQLQLQCMSHSEKEYETTIWGPTCDSSDNVCTLTMTELDIGDWLWFF